MANPTPFHNRTEPLCKSWEWRNWSGYLAASVYEPTHEREYFAIRNSAAFIDVSPLFKIHVSGPDARALIDRVITRDMARCTLGRVLYTPWCNHNGKLIDDGTVTCLAPDLFRVTAAHPPMRWFQEAGADLNATVSDVSAEIAALAVQGPKSRAILTRLLPDIDFASLPYYGSATGIFANQPITVTRTGYTGDLGYELWLPAELAEPLWDALINLGRAYAALPAGLVALDMARIEAGLPLIDVDYKSAHDATTPAQTSSPFEMGMGWTVDLDRKGDFLGREALQAEREQPARWRFVGVEVDWFELERLYAPHNLRPPVAGSRASRIPTPITVDGRQVGQATSLVFSPLLRRLIALASIEADYAQANSAVAIDLPVEFSRQPARATVKKLPFFNPARKRALKNGD